MKDLHGQAAIDYYKEDEHPLLLHNSYGEPEEMPVEVFFREEEDFTYLEHLAISNCQGKVLDLGAGAGAHSLFMQNLGFDIEALDYSAGCAHVMRELGINKVLEKDYRKLSGKYDTVLMLMNGIGIAGTLNEVPNLILKCFELLNEGGHIIFDSSDISYLYPTDDDKPEHYFGEVKYQYDYKGQKGEWFNWVYVDTNTITDICNQLNVSCEILFQGQNDEFLAKIYKDS